MRERSDHRRPPAVLRRAHRRRDRVLLEPVQRQRVHDGAGRLGRDAGLGDDRAIGGRGVHGGVHLRLPGRWRACWDRGTATRGSSRALRGRRCRRPRRRGRSPPATPTSPRSRHRGARRPTGNIRQRRSRPCWRSRKCAPPAVRARGETAPDPAGVLLGSGEADELVGLHPDRALQPGPVDGGRLRNGRLTRPSAAGGRDGGNSGPGGGDDWRAPGMPVPPDVRPGRGGQSTRRSQPAAM